MCFLSSPKHIQPFSPAAECSFGAIFRFSHRGLQPILIFRLDQCYYAIALKLLEKCCQSQSIPRAEISWIAFTFIVSECGPV